MLSGEANENSQKFSRSNQQNKQTNKQLCTCSTLSQYISLPMFCRTNTLRNFQKLLVTCFMGYCLLCFRCRSFSLWWPLTFPLFLTVVIYKIVMFFFQRNWSACFLTFAFALALSLLSTSMQTLKLSGSKESALSLLFLSLKVR